MPRPLRPIADGLVYHVINRGNNRQSVFRAEGDYAAFLKGIADLVASVVPYEALAAGAAARRRRWWAYVHATPDETELAAIRRSSETGLPYGERTWVDRLCRRLKLDLTIRPRGRPRKASRSE